MPVALIEWRSVQKNSLRGFAVIRVGKSLTIKDLTVHRSNGRVWVGMPSKPLLDPSGSAKRDDAGKIKYLPILEWSDRATADRFSESVIAAIEAQHPGATA